MADAFSDFDLRSVPLPRLRIGGEERTRYPASYASTLGHGIDNLVKWLVWSQAGRALSFDANGEEVHLRSVRSRVFTPRHLRAGVSWQEERLGIPNWRKAEGGIERPSADAVYALREQWEREWFTKIAEGIVRPLILGNIDSISDQLLGDYLQNFIWSPRLRQHADVLEAASTHFRELASRIDVAKLMAELAIIDANFGLPDVMGAHFYATAVEPDLVLDGVLIDIKLTTGGTITRRLFEEMIRYLLCFELQVFAEQTDSQLTLLQRVPHVIRIDRIGIFVAERGEVVTWDRRDWLSDEKLEELRGLYLRNEWRHARRHEARPRHQMDLFGRPRRSRNV